MEFLDSFTRHIQFNFFSFSTLLVFAFTFLFAVFFLSLRNKSESTLHLGIGCLFLSLFNLGYFFAASYYDPIAAYHRWFTGGFVLPAILHFGQFFFKYPRDTNPSLSKKTLIGMWTIALIADAIFITGTFSADRKFHFTGHYWDFDAEPISKMLAVLIAIYSFISFFLIAMWKFFVVKTKERWTILKILIAMLIAAVTPNVTNIMSRDGSIERSVYLISLTACFVVGFFMIAIFYVNSTRDRTTVIVKIVGVTMVTILLIMQASSFYSMKDKDADYDTLRLENMTRILEGGDKYKDTRYFINLRLDEYEINKKEYPESINLDLSLAEIDFRNTVIYDDIVNLSENNYRLSLNEYLFNTHPYFEGYKNAVGEFLVQNKDMRDRDLKVKIPSLLDDLNKFGFIQSNKISAIDKNGFCDGIRKHLSGGGKISGFRKVIETKLQNCKWEGRDIDSVSLKHEISKYFRFLQPSLSRIYRKSLDPYSNQKHFISYIYYDIYTQTVSEIGYSYYSYRQYMHGTAINQQMVLVIVVFVIIGAYPFFFKGSLTEPLWSLVHALEKVNHGDLEVEVPIRVQDEIGFLSDSFNSMVISIKYARSELTHYADTLEEKVNDRTREVQEKMDEVQKLKLQQDGDYFLTSLLTKPLFMNANKSPSVKTDFFIEQKKRFEFRNKMVEIGGDICITGNLRLGTSYKHKRYTMAMNGDAMGKSMQGAGGCIVMGVVMNSIMSRSAAKDWILDKTPEMWLTDIYYEINRVFKTFNGSMVISCVVMLIDDETGEAFYFNAEHPFSVLYRNGKSYFIEDRLNLRKLGLDSEIPFQVFKFQLVPGDIVIIGSDGRDDVDITPDEPVRTINEDETLFLKHVEAGRASLEEIVKSLRKMGEFIDDLSLMRISYKESEVKRTDEMIAAPVIELPIDIDFDNTEMVYSEAKKLLRDGKDEAARLLMAKCFSRGDHTRENNKFNKLFGLLAFQSRDYTSSATVIRKYLQKDPDYLEFWYYLGIAEKKLGHYNLAQEAAEKLSIADPNHILNLLNLADIYRLMGKLETARMVIDDLLTKDPENKTGLKLLEMINRG